VQFTWDERKNRSNQAKHGVSFETAVLAFADPYQLSRPDQEVEGEVRWHTIGMVQGSHVLLVAHTVSEPNDDGEEIIRVISARKATPRERIIYAQGL
jgi:uncharacterized protein